MNTLKVSELTERLIRAESITPDDAGCQPLINEVLEAHGFTVQDFSLQLETGTGKHTVTNTFAFVEGKGSGEGPSVIFAGHTDVVGVEDQDWQSNPFELTEKDGLLVGRGIADMKGGLAPTVTAAAKFVADNPNFSGKIGFVITSFEEKAQNKEVQGQVAKLGTNHVVTKLLEQGYPVDYVIVGEPTSSEIVGDTIKNGRGCSMDVMLTTSGKSAHEGYIEPGATAGIGVAAIGNLVTNDWQTSVESFPTTKFHYKGDGQEPKPGTAAPEFTFTNSVRFSPPYNSQSLRAEIEQIVASTLTPYSADVTWQLAFTDSGEPYFTLPSSPIIRLASKAIERVTGIKVPKLSAEGGTSDGRFLVKLKNAAGKPTEVIEIGNIGTTLHEVNEAVPTGSLEELEAIHYGLLKEIFG